MIFTILTKMKRNLIVSKRIIEIDAGDRLYCYRTATKGWKGNKRLISWFKRFVGELVKTHKRRR